ncbi:MAG: enoyl-CoA hydratase-related protein [Chloroflexota bacterium]|nr:enoyl-CoA hydratase-related protein [Chloroflexota bacterium]
MSALSQLSLERHDDIAVISGGVTLSADFIGRLADLSSAVADDVRVVVLHPDKRVWSGFDGVTDAGDLFAGLAEIAQPTIAVLDGPTFGGGLELALTADIRVAATDCQIGLAALTDGFPRAGGVQRLTRAVGRSRATQLLLLEDQIDSATACEWGLVNLVADDALEAAWQVAGSIASRGPIATRYAKDAIRHGLEMPLAQALHYETELTILLQDTNDRAEGVDAFVNKRAPQFSGT